MGHIKHHAIIVTSWNKDIIYTVRVLAVSLFGKQVSGLADSAVNAYYTFIIGPDGSSESWEESERADELRFQFKVALKNFCYVDGSSPVSWIEVSYNDDMSQNAEIIEHNLSQ